MAPAPAKGVQRAPQGDKSASKKALFDDSASSSSDDDQEDGGATLAPSAELKINEEYARRFEHNKKREELHRLQEKYKPGAGGDEESESSSEDEPEDDEAALITEDLDAEISATLQAIKNKDPRIYDKDAVFYTPFDATAEKPKKEDKPLFLRDYHRERYLSGDVGADDDSAAAVSVPRTFAQEQDDIKQSILSEINAATAADEEEWSDDDAFIKPVKKDDAPTETGIHPSRAAHITLTELDVATADKDPEDYLSKFMASKAWAPEGAGSNWQAFESDDGEDADDIADEFEHAYNMRFEDPDKSNEFLKTYSRNMAAARSARKEELTGRKKQRALEKERKEAEEKEREMERARLRRLKIDEASERLAKIKQAAGISGKALTDEEWLKFLDDAWDDDKWEEEMKKRFNDEYYAQADDMFMDEDEDEDDHESGTNKQKKKPKKPKWDDDIDIKDIISDFDDEFVKPNITLSDEDLAQDQQASEQQEDEPSDTDSDSRPTKKRKTTADLKKDRLAAKRQARAELAKIEALVDRKIEIENPRALQSSSKSTTSGGGGGGGFRYRETSPNSFGLTARDILLAPSDAALNEFAGLKKLATFRDAEKKRKDKKRLGKKARLRQWRRETFGRDYEQDGPTFGFEALLKDGGDAKAGGSASASASGSGSGSGRKREEKNPNRVPVPVVAGGEGGIVEGERKKKRKRSKKGKKSVNAEA